jgi:hypothetical protein
VSQLKISDGDLGDFIGTSPGVVEEQKKGALEPLSGCMPVRKSPFPIRLNDPETKNPSRKFPEDFFWSLVVGMIVG